MKLELQDEKGSTGVFIELPVEQLRGELGLGSALAETLDLGSVSAQVEAQLKEQGEQVARLQEKLALAEGRTMHDYSPEEKADFVIAWAKVLDPENMAIFAEIVGIPITKVADGKVAEVAEGEKPNIIQGKTTKPGYKYLEYLNLSVREE